MIERQALTRSELDYALLPRNDMGNAERLLGRHGDDMMFADRIGWMVWNGTRWVSELGAVEASLMAQRTVSAMSGELQAYRDYVRDGADSEKQAQGLLEKASAWAISSGNAGRVRGMLDIAQPHVTVPPETIDAGVMLFNAQDCTMQLPARRDGAGDDPVVWRKPFRRDDRITRMANASFDDSAQCPTWLAFLERVQPEPDMRRFLRQWAGYCLTGLTTEQVMVINYGQGANGKSTFCETLGYVFGSYAQTIPIQSFMADKRRGGADASPDLARLPGVRLLLAAEPEQGDRLSETLVKQITGGEALPVRHLFQGLFNLIPQFKIMLSCNIKPRIRGTDEGIWRRCLLIPWLVMIPKAERDPALVRRLQGEADGILAWAVQGLMDWAENGLCVPKSVIDATEDYRAESDPIQAFLSLYTARGLDSDRIGASTLYEVYKQYCRASSRDPVDQTAFGNTMSSKGYQKIKSSTYFYKTIKFNNDGLELFDETNKQRNSYE